MQRAGQFVFPADLFRPVRQAGQHQPHHRQLFVKGRGPKLGHSDRLPPALQDVLHMVHTLIFAVQLQIIGEIAGDAGKLDILAHHIPVHLQPQRLVGADQLAEVLPAPGGGKLQALRRGLHPVKMLFFNVQIGHHRPVDALFPGVFLPDGEILLHIDALDPVQRHHIKVPHRFVVFRGIARGHDEPTLRQGLVAEGLALEKLQHHGRQRFRHAVDLIQKEDALLQPGLFHQAVD